MTETAFPPQAKPDGRYRVAPYHRPIERAKKISAKYCLWGWSEVDNEGVRFENLIASHLLKFCHFLRDANGVNADLRLLRDREKREVDFVVPWNERPWFLVECKPTVPRRHGHLVRYGELLDVRQRYVVTLSERDDYYDRDTGVRVLPASRFLTALPQAAANQPQLFREPVYKSDLTKPPSTCRDVPVI
jgi:hypothetical protein